jgi:hypothetical protein
MSGTSAGWATAKENWAALHCSIDIVCDTVLKLVISEISVGHGPPDPLYRSTTELFRIILEFS